MVEHILFPSSYYSIRKVDEDLQQEFDAVIETNLFKTLFFGYSEWFDEGRIVLSEKPETEIVAVYRGWMMQPERYNEFYHILLENNIRLVTSPKQYEKMHIFPNVYPEIAEDTAQIMVFPDGMPIDLKRVKASFARFMVKDFVKSVKGTEFPKFFTRDIEEKEFEKWMDVFYGYRGGLYTGGICVKEYLDLKSYDGKTNEYRIFVINNKVATVCRNSLQSDFTIELPRELAEKYVHFDSPMYTVDYAELADGTWKIIEVGDGQVSGLSEGQDYRAFFRALYYCFA